MPFLPTSPQPWARSECTNSLPRCFPHLLFLTALGFGPISWATTLKREKDRGVRGGGAVFLTGAHLAFNACRWLPVARWPLPGPGPAPRRRHRLRHRRARSCPRPPPAVPPPSPGLGEQLHGSSQVAGIFNCEANESTIVQVCTYPASPRRDRKANPPFSFKTRIWRFALSSEGGEGGWGEPKQYFSCKIKCKML